MKYTVVGRYSDNFQTFVEFVEAEGVLEAGLSVLGTPDREGPDEIVSVFEGHHPDLWPDDGTVS